MLTPEQKRQYEETGFFHLGHVFDDDELREIRAEYDRVLARPMKIGEKGKEPFDYAALLQLQNETLCRYATSPKLVRAAVDLLGPDVRLWWDQAVYKPPGATSEVPWHQDNGYAPIVPLDYLTFTVAIDATTTENGCLWVLPGSHKEGRQPHRPTDTLFHRGYDGPEAGEPVPQEEGDVLVFSSLLMHRTSGNDSAQPRRSWVIQFCRADSRHDETDRVYDDRLLVAKDAEPLAQPYRERPLDLEALIEDARARR